MNGKYQTSSVRSRASALFGRALFFAGAIVWPLAAASPLRAASPPQTTSLQQVGKVTGLPLPRYVSLKSDRVNLRQGPSKDHQTLWVFERAGLPVEITEEFDTWRKIRDSQGTVGWVLESLLSGRRTALVKPWAKGEMLSLFARPEAGSRITAKLQSGVLGNVTRCTGSWCHIFGSGFNGWIQQTNLWGVYPNEKID